ncbi:N-acetylmuramoyl-L-alanine amidase family protein [Bacteroides pyogenes]|uniref:N-acetylmuramoyl-L-alanine amidase family protein n=1 Tax=Bacteroides pyogenes TaxID=310300 RepID=UPI001BAA299A|nr:N-acetylmuramoyl-L-alanine amidase [Bacteroides pyogenes]MBR8726054.1 hypothetical protein [Bacteroides pyogenes]MBR8739341.1 hypothetical protein [Bacteroides pyogenes]MBR8755218.1 hypothetical protein [Bacteroides pyogenes]MBR8796530.1 hypothetical protein [Bacteroides pyogenes]MBR8810054.1 hypothetical protein [Bacteroides pyogenes]
MKKRFGILLCFSVFFLIPGAKAQEKATPKAGEGISTFLLRHNRSPKKYYNDFVELNRKQLGKEEVLKMGMTYVIPPVKRTKTVSGKPLADKLPAGGKKKIVPDKPSRKGTSIHQPLFGKQLADVPVTSERLAGSCFYIVSGHGGPDPGAIGYVGKHELHEDEYAYDIALRLARNLMQEGAEVHIIIRDAKDGIRDDAYLSNSKRETCMGAPIPLNQVQRLKQRCERINTLYREDRKNYAYCRAIFIHVDSRSKGKQTDVFFYHSMKKAESKRLAYNMKDLFESKYGKHQPNRGFSGTVSERNLYVLAYTHPASVFVELGNIQNTFDQRRLVINSNRQALANWLMEGFIKDYKLTFK